MQLNFNLEDINYLRLYNDDENSSFSIKMAISEKTENEIIAISNRADNIVLSTPAQISLDIVCNDGLYRTTTILKEVVKDGVSTKFIMENPKTLDYQQNRNYYRILAEYDCIYTVDTNSGIESFNAVTYDISAGGVSIIIDENIVSMEEMSILIFFPERDLKSHLKFVRCEMFDKNYKLSFEFTDLSERDVEFLKQLCTYKQLN